MFVSFETKFTFLCLRQVYGVFSRRLFPAFDHFGVLLLQKIRLTSVFLCVCPFIDDKFRQNIVKVYCGTNRLRVVVPQPV